MSAVTGLIIACLAFSVYVSPSLQIVGGNDALYPHPYQAALFVREGSKNVYFCGGAIITKRYVLTAAYCLASRHNNLQNYYVGVGSVLLNETITYRVDALIPHAGYHSEAYHFGINNIGLVRVLRDIVFNENVQPIKLPDSDRNYDNYPFIVTGWGKTLGIGSQHSNTLQELVVKVFAGTYSYREYNEKYLLCFESEPGEGMCGLDDGNPVVTDGVLVGVVAPRFVECGRSGWIDVFSKVFYYKSWIEFHVGSI